MKFKIFNVALLTALTATAFTASAQKKYTEGVANYSFSTPMGDAESPVYFSADSSVVAQQRGPASIKLISTTKGDYFAVLVNVPVMNMKKAAIASPAELEQFADAEPKFTFTPGTETKEISGYKCTKFTAKEEKSGKTYDAWVTKDISAPANGASKFYAGIDGFPVQFTTLQQGMEIKVTLKSITEQKNPAGTFGIPAGYDKITFADLAAMGGKQ